MTSVVVWVLIDPPLCSPWLSGAERRRRDALHREADRRAFVGGAVLVRRAAADATGAAPAEISVDRTCRRCGEPHGPPAVPGGPHLSVGHCTSTDGAVAAVLAVRPDGPVGVDVEPAGRVVEPEIADLLLTAAERATLPDPADLLRYWVRKEAVLKSAGVGLLVPPTDIEVSGPRRPAALLSPGPADPRTRLLDVPLDGLCCSVAAPSDVPLTTRVVRARVADGSLLP